MNADGKVFAGAARMMIQRARTAKRLGDIQNARGYAQLARQWNRRARNSSAPLTSAPMHHNRPTDRGIDDMTPKDEKDGKDGKEENGTQPKPVQLRTARDYTLTVQALEHRSGELTKLAKKTSEEGYPRESRVVAADAAAITTYILPQFKAQQELPLVSTDKLRSHIADAFRGLVRRFLSVGGPRRSGDAFQSPEDKVCDEIARRVEAFAVEIAGNAYAAGYAARNNEPEAVALRSVPTLSVSGLE